MVTYSLTREVRQVRLPDPSYYVEVITIGMKVTCCVREDRGSFSILREMYHVEKTKHKWWEFVAKFEQMAAEKYSQPHNSMANLYKSSS